MVVTKEQYYNDLRGELEKLGYVECEVDKNFTDHPLLVINSAGKLMCLGNYRYEAKDAHNRYLIEPYNKDLFLSEAAKLMGKEYNKSFEKKDLKTGMLLKHRNGGDKCRFN